MFGRRRLVPELNSRNGQIRARGRARDREHADPGHRRRHPQARDDRPPRRAAAARRCATRMILTVHDELLFEAPRDEADAAAAVVRERMETRSTLQRAADGRRGHRGQLAGREVVIVARLEPQGTLRAFDVRSRACTSSPCAVCVSCALSPQLNIRASGRDDSPSPSSLHASLACRTLGTPQSSNNRHETETDEIRSVRVDRVPRRGCVHPRPARVWRRRRTSSCGRRRRDDHGNGVDGRRRCHGGRRRAGDQRRTPARRSAPTAAGRPGELRRDDVHRGGRHGVPPVDARQGAEQQLRATTRSFVQFSDSVTSIGRGDVAHRARRRRPRGCSRTAPGAGCRDGAGTTTATARACRPAGLLRGRAAPHTLRIQVREDGLSIDQIVLSPSTYLTTSPARRRTTRRS